MGKLKTLIFFEISPDIGKETEKWGLRVLVE